MGVAYNPQIVTNGLVLCLDAGNQKSYPGSGATWTDLSGNGNNGTLVNGVGYNGANGGIFTLDGTDDYINIPINLTNTQYTIIATARYTGSINSRVITSTSGNWIMGWWAGQTNMYYAEGWVSPDSGGTTETSWITYAGTGNYTADSWSLYRNGNLLISPNSNGTNGPNGIRVGQSGVYTNEISTCEVSYILAYNRILTAAEVQQNFNAKRSRFGI
jgi:hypothetical protein